MGVLSEVEERETRACETKHRDDTAPRFMAALVRRLAARCEELEGLLSDAMEGGVRGSVHSTKCRCSWCSAVLAALASTPAREGAEPDGHMPGCQCNGCYTKQVIRELRPTRVPEAPRQITPAVVARLKELGASDEVIAFAEKHVDGAPTNPSETADCTQHQILQISQDNPDGSETLYWECEDCGAEFVPRGATPEGEE
jgi:hypothetical protein